MNLGRSWRTAAVVSLAALALLPACRRRKPAEVNDIVPKVEFNRPRAPLGSAVEVTYTWQVEPTAKKLAIISFKNPKKDIIVYLEADTNYKAFDQPPVLTIAVGNKAGLVVPIENSEVFLKKVHVKAADLGDQEWVDLRLSMNQSFIPKAKGINPSDDRELGLMRYNLYVGEADKLGAVPSVVEAVPVSLPPLSTASPAPGASPGTKGAPAGKG